MKPKYGTELLAPVVVIDPKVYEIQALDDDTVWDEIWVCPKDHGTYEFAYILDKAYLKAHARIVKLEVQASIVTDLRDALFRSPEFENFECEYGPKLGTCGNECCFICAAYNLLKQANAEGYAT